MPGSFYIQGRASVLPFYVVRLPVRRCDAPECVLRGVAVLDWCL
nr:MAG TPA: hypothetical protein [Caudoviricetes sp.]